MIGEHSGEPSPRQNYKVRIYQQKGFLSSVKWDSFTQSSLGHTLSDYMSHNCDFEHEFPVISHFNSEDIKRFHNCTEGPP